MPERMTATLSRKSRNERTTDMSPTPWDFVDDRSGNDKSAQRTQGNQGTAGDYGATSNAPVTDVPLNDYPNLRGYSYDDSNSQFSRDKNWEPQAMADEARGQSDTTNDLISYFNTSPYTAGSRVCHE